MPPAAVSILSGMGTKGASNRLRITYREDLLVPGRTFKKGMRARKPLRPGCVPAMRRRCASASSASGSTTRKSLSRLTLGFLHAPRTLRRIWHASAFTPSAAGYQTCADGRRQQQPRTPHHISVVFPDT